MLALAHGYGKLPPSERFIDGTGNLGFPVPVVFAWAASLSEFFGALLVAIGLATRPAAFFAAAVMATAAFVAHSADPFDKREMALLFLAIMVTVMFTGPGRYSLDALIGGKKR
jgi:putative oxidoreductase